MIYTTQQLAWQEVAKAKNTGKLVEPRHCQMCGMDERSARAGRKKPWGDAFIAHHWRGYDHPLDVWFVCPSCHKRMRDLHIDHDGLRTLTEVRALLGYGGGA